MKRLLRFAALLAAALGLAAARAQYYPPEIPEDNGPSYTALWWNPAESGWGLNTNHQDDIVFATLFTYAADGGPMWLVGPNLARAPGQLTFSGPLYRTTGPAFNAQPWTSIASTQVGTMSIEFLSESSARVTYGFSGSTVTKTVQRQVFAEPVPECVAVFGSRAGVFNYQDLWWNPAESGWGMNMAQQGTVIFATLFTYAPDGRDLWIVGPGLRRQPDASYTGAIYTTRGPAFDASPWTPITVTEVGSMTLRFLSGDRATLAYTYDGATVSKTIQRQVFGAAAPACR
jgi:hypothetical protein